jgi:phosphatidylglycerol:prolipoprotein diacylglycerol transferase
MSRRLHPYKVLLYLGCSTGVTAGAAFAPARGIDSERFAFTTIALLIPALVGARLWFVARHWERYRLDLARVVRRSEGGAGLFGGLVVGVLASAPAVAVAGMGFFAFWDAASVTMLVGLAWTRLGCLRNGCCGGRVTRGGHRYPTQLMETAWALILLVGVVTIGRDTRPGVAFGVVVACYCAGRVVTEALRAESRLPRLAVQAAS